MAKYHNTGINSAERETTYAGEARLEESLCRVLPLLPRVNYRKLPN